MVSPRLHVSSQHSSKLKGIKDECTEKTNQTLEENKYHERQLTEQAVPGIVHQWDMRTSIKHGRSPKKDKDDTGKLF